MIAKIYLLAVSLLYFSLAIWCTLSPKETSAKVGFELRGGSGQSEFMTVYGGLEFGIALVLAAAMVRNGTVNFGVLCCVLLHGSLVVFRTLSYLRFSDIGPFTWQLAMGEWVVMLLGIAVLFFARVKQVP